MNILFFTEYFPDLSKPIFTGGVENRMYRLASFLRDRGHEAVVQKRTETYSFNTPKILVDRFVYFWRLLTGVEGKNYDIVEGTNFVTYLPAFFRAKWVGARSVAWYPDVFVGNAIERLGFINGLITEIAEWIALRLPWDGIIALSQETKRKLITHGVNRKKISVINGGVELNSEFRIQNSELQKFKKQTLLCIARLVQYKRVQDLLFAAYLLKEKFPQIRVVVVGDGPEKQHLIKLCKQLGMLSTVKWKTGISEKEKCDLLRQSTLHVLPSVVEGFGLVTAEALACGTPVINTDTPINREVLNGEKGGLLYPSCDYVALSECIERLLTDQTLYNRKAQEGLQLVKKYEWNIINKQTETFYQRLLSH